MFIENRAPYLQSFAGFVNGFGSPLLTTTEPNPHFLLSKSHLPTAVVGHFDCLFS